jgi:hypothetical protein
MSRPPVALLAGSLLALIGCGPAPPAPAAGPLPGPAIDVGDGAEFLAAFRANSVVASREWVGKRVRLTATVTQVDPNEGEPYLQLAGGRFLVVPATAERGAFGRLAAGAAVTVEGTVDVPTTGVPPLTLSGAALVPPGP